MNLTLCYAPQTCATVPFITLTEAGADFEVMNLNSRSGQLRSPEFLKLNPKHKVPVLLVDGEVVLLEGAKGRIHRLPYERITRGRLEVEF